MAFLCGVGAHTPAAWGDGLAQIDAGTPDAAAVDPATHLRRGSRRRHRRMDGGVPPTGADGGSPAPVAPLAAPIAVPPTTSPSVPSAGAAAGATDALAGKEFNSCHKIPVGKRVAKLNLKPDSDLMDLVAWISAITCKQFVIGGTIGAGAKKVTIVAPGLMTRDEAYAVFLRALDSLGLTVEKSGRFLKVIETSKAKSSAVPTYDFDGRPMDR